MITCQSLTPFTMSVFLWHCYISALTSPADMAVRPMAHDPSSPLKNWDQNLVPETWVQVLHTRRTRNWYQNAWHMGQVSGTSFWYQFLGGELGSCAMGLSVYPVIGCTITHKHPNILDLRDVAWGVQVNGTYSIRLAWVSTPSNFRNTVVRSSVLHWRMT